MRYRPALAALLLGAGLASAEPPKPVAVVQAKPVSRLLGEFREMVRQTGGPAAGERMVKEFEQAVKDALGEEGFDGLDVNRPLAAYVALPQKDAEPKAEDARVVVVVPVTGEKEFVGFLGRLDVKAEAVKGKPGLYTLDPDGGPFPNASHLRFTDAGWAYLTFNDGDPTDPKDLVPANDLVDEADPALLTARLFPPRVPAKLAGKLFDQLDAAADQMKQFVGFGVQEKHWAKFFTTVLEQGPKLVRRYGEAVLKDATEAAVRVSFDRQTGDSVTELAVAPRAGTGLARDVAAWGKTTNRFAGLVTKDAALGVVAKAPLFAKELREIGTALTDAVAEEVKELELPEKLKAAAEEAVKGIGRSVGAGALDAAVALHGPDKDGKFALVAGLSFDDPSGLEKALRAAAKDADLAKDFQFDAARAGDVAVHKVPLARLLPEDARGDFEKVFGDGPAGYAAFTKDAVFVGFGAGALEHLKAAVAAKPGPAAVLDVTGNMKRLQKLAAAIDPMAGEKVAEHLGVADRAAGWLRLTLDGGERLTAKLTINVRYLPRLSALEEGAGAAPPPR